MDTRNDKGTRSTSKRKENKDGQLEENSTTNNKRKKLERRQSRISLVRDRRSSHCGELLIDSESELYQSIPNNIAPEDRLRMLLRQSFEMALNSSLDNLPNHDDLSEFKLTVRRSFTSFLAKASSQQALERAVILSKPEEIESVVTKEDIKIKESLEASKAYINRLQKESKEWERVKKESTAVEAFKPDCTDDAQMKDDEERYEMALKKLQNSQQRLLTQLKDIALASTAVNRLKETAEEALTKPTLQLYTATSHKDCVKDLVNDILT